MTEGLMTVARTPPPTLSVPPSLSVALAPGVRLTGLPFGGAVLINERTLALAECAEHDAVLLQRLLAKGKFDASDTDVLRLARHLLETRWLVVTDDTAA
ncbi:actinodefensin-associated protein B [Streptomyces scopuliridis]|uniref:actinodefensin-associated protein B n=1 Tax=Streptomyces scopuliridis TaxID=452529 RepID=UPI0036B52517